MAIPKRVIEEVKKNGERVSWANIKSGLKEEEKDTPKTAKIYKEYFKANKGREIWSYECGSELVSNYLDKVLPRNNKFMSTFYDKYFHVAISKDKRIIDYNEDSADNYNVWLFAF